MSEVERQDMVEWMVANGGFGSRGHCTDFVFVRTIVILIRNCDCPSERTRSVDIQATSSNDKVRYLGRSIEHFGRRIVYTNSRAEI